MMSRRWRTGGVGVRPLAAGSRSPWRQELGGRGGAAAAVAAAGVGGRGGERGVVIRHRRAASTRRERRVVAGGVVSKARGRRFQYRSRPATAGTAADARRASPPRPRRRRPRRGLMPGRNARRRRASCRERLFHSSGAAPGTSRHHPFARPKPSPSSAIKATPRRCSRPLLLTKAARASCTCPATGAFLGAAAPSCLMHGAASSRSGSGRAARVDAGARAQRRCLFMTPAAPGRLQAVTAMR